MLANLGGLVFIAKTRYRGLPDGQKEICYFSIRPDGRLTACSVEWYERARWTVTDYEASAIFVVYHQLHSTGHPIDELYPGWSAESYRFLYNNTRI
jgi:hypothetical protein